MNNLEGGSHYHQLQQLKGLLGIKTFTKKTDIVFVMRSVWTNVHHGWNWETIVIGLAFLAFPLLAKYIEKKQCCRDNFYLAVYAAGVSLECLSIRVVNYVQCHLYDCVIATSGIDSTIKIWTPSFPVPSIVAGGAVGLENSNVLDAMEGNQRRLCRTREAILK